MALLAFLFYLFTFGATDTGEQVEQAVALATGLYGLSAIAGRRAPHAVAPS